MTTSRDTLVGVGWLLRLHLRFDRVRLCVWTVGFLVVVWASVLAVREAYPTPESLQTRAQLLHNPAAIMMTGPLFGADDYTLGAAVANELMLYVLVPAAIMSVLLVVRHTRAEEESGRLELVRALPVGRFAPAAAAVLTVGLANLLVAGAVTVALWAAGGVDVDSVAFGAATGLTGLFFGALTATLAQMSTNVSVVRGIALGAVAGAYVIRGVGDVLNAQGSWLSWFSPLAWAQQTRVYVDLRWWPLLVSVAATLALLALAAVLGSRRDLGSGLWPTRPGRARAPFRLLSPAGLAWRLNAGTFAAWGMGLAVFAVAMGSLADALEEMMLETPGLQEWVELDMSQLTRSFSALILSFLVLAPAGLIVGGVLGLRNEESGGRTDGTLVSGSSRTGYLTGWVGVIAALGIAVTVVAGVAAGVGVAWGTGDWAWVGELTVASLAYLPAVLFFGALTVAAHGWAPRIAPVVWAVVGWAAIVAFLGELLGLPDWARGISPLWHTPLLPDADVEVLPLLALALAAAALAAVGFVGYRRRDLSGR